MDCSNSHEVFVDQYTDKFDVKIIYNKGQCSLRALVGFPLTIWGFKLLGPVRMYCLVRLGGHCGNVLECRLTGWVIDPVSEV